MSLWTCQGRLLQKKAFEVVHHMGCWDEFQRSSCMAICQISSRSTPFWSAPWLFNTRSWNLCSSQTRRPQRHSYANAETVFLLSALAWLTFVWLPFPVKTEESILQPPTGGKIYQMPQFVWCNGLNCFRIHWFHLGTHNCITAKILLCVLKGNSWLLRSLMLHSMDQL